MKQLPSYSALRAFESAARLGSFKLAAAELSLTTSAISHQIRLLERELGETLFERHPNGIMLTDAAQHYLPFVRKSFDILDEGTQAIRNRQHSLPLRVSLLSSLSTLWLIPKLEEYRKCYPGNNVELIDSVDLEDFHDNNLDLAIRYDFSSTGRWNDLIVHPLLEETVFPVCSPDFLTQHSGIEGHDWNNNHTLLVNSRHPDEWECWSQFADFDQTNTRKPNTRKPQRIVMDTSNMTLIAARSGLGLALGRTPFVDLFLARGELVQVGSAVQQRGHRHYLVYPEKNASSTSLIQFRDWLLDTA